jgi:hypothetical protein
MAADFDTQKLIKIHVLFPPLPKSNHPISGQCGCNLGTIKITAE